MYNVIQILNPDNSEQGIFECWSMDYKSVKYKQYTMYLRTRLTKVQSGTWVNPTLDSIKSRARSDQIRPKDYNYNIPNYTFAIWSMD